MRARRSPAIEAAFPGTTADGKVDRVKLGCARAGRPAALRAARSHRPSAGAGGRAALPRRSARRRATRSRCSISRCCSRPAATAGRRGGGGVGAGGGAARARAGAARDDRGKARGHAGQADAGCRKAPPRRFRRGYVAGIRRRARAGACDLARSLQCRNGEADLPLGTWHMREIVLDTETTGLDPCQGHRLVEIGCIELVNRFPSGQGLPPLSQSGTRHAGRSLRGAWPVGRVSAGTSRASTRSATS